MRGGTLYTCPYCHKVKDNSDENEDCCLQSKIEKHLQFNELKQEGVHNWIERVDIFYQSKQQFTHHHPHPKRHKTKTKR